MKPPSTGEMVVPSIIASVTLASARGSRQSWNRSPSTARDTVKVAAQPIACTMRAITSSGSVAAEAANAEPAAKIARPPSITGRRP